MRDAETSVREAEQARAGTRATYELTLAKLYLDKAREEAAEAQYAVARRYLERSEQNARRALVRAESATVGAGR